ncbi:hypothetical protein [Risungbinella massiliensis]|uniref:hypothetical protein n=1 Tax=Risungbinella massiliensis TaxID=1329796 RepID=UPI0005CBA100|nr:hypothetical protein [Risungbinella massiliensis]
MYAGRNLDELKMTTLSEWNLEELSYHHYMMSQLAPYINQEGTSLHVDMIKEIEKRGGLQNLTDHHYKKNYWLDENV